MKRIILGLTLLFFGGEKGAAQSRIVNGKDAENGAYPWMVSIGDRGVDPYFGQFCGGCLIDSEWVLTAAHCTKGVLPYELEIYAGVTDLDDTSGAEKRYITEIRIHPGYFGDEDGDLCNDIALLKLSSPITSIDPIAFPGTAEAVGDGTSLRAIGWGFTQSIPAFPSILNEVDLNAVTFSSLAGWIGEPRINQRHIGAMATGKDTCQGDSGGPLFLPNSPGSGKPLLIGITSYGLGCAAGIPGVYANVGNYAKWINDVIGGGDGITSPEIFLYSNAVPIADGSKRTSRTNNTDFGSPLRFGQKRSRTFAIYNNGAGSSLQIRKIKIKRSPFRVKRKLNEVQTGRVGEFSIELRGSNRLRVRGKVRLITNDPLNPIFQLNLLGRSRRHS